MRNGLESLNKVLSENTKVLSVFTTAGYPKIDSALEICQTLDEVGVGFIELGIPFSDPIADGETIQKTSDVALKNGMNVETIFSQVKELRKNSSIPIILMGYFNPVLQFGIDKFFQSCVDSGVDGLIIPDLPRDQYIKSWKKVLEEKNLSYVFMITPQTTEQRIREIDELSTTFIYAVSSSGVTGGSVDTEAQEKYYAYLKSLNLKHPIMIGFGIRDKKSFDLASKYVKGAIIGSEFLRKIEKSENLKEDIRKFIFSVI